MHELGMLTQALKKVALTASQNGIERVRYITLEVGEASGYVPAYFKKLFPAARELFPPVRSAELRILSVPGKGLRIKNLAY